MLPIFKLFFGLFSFSEMVQCNFHWLNLITDGKLVWTCCFSVFLKDGVRLNDKGKQMYLTESLSGRVCMLWDPPEYFIKQSIIFYVLLWNWNAFSLISVWIANKASADGNWWASFIISLLLLLVNVCSITETLFCILWSWRHKGNICTSLNPTVSQIELKAISHIECRFYSSLAPLHVRTSVWNSYEWRTIKKICQFGSIWWIHRYVEILFFLFFPNEFWMTLPWREDKAGWEDCYQTHSL